MKTKNKQTEKERKLYNEKRRLQRKRKSKPCFGSKEFGEKSGICKNCKWMEDCKEVEPKLKYKEMK